MEKSYLKHVLTLLDNYEIRGIDLAQAVDDVYDQLRRELDHYPSKKQIEADLQSIADAGMMRLLSRGYDVTPNATIFARSAAHARLEDLALFACIYDSTRAHDKLDEVLFAPAFTSEQLTGLLSPLLSDIALQCRLFAPISDTTYRIASPLTTDCQRIAQEHHGEHPPLVSPTVLCQYLKTICPSAKGDWKNTDRAIIDYPYLAEILQMLPRRGIPNNRDDSRQLQAFYKDTLFHEFDHRCPICGIHLPHMLIASHIKPFRDCAHLYEPIDNNNGLLLCRNHDYLFDQGYISFHDDGRLLVCSELRAESDYQTTYHLPKDFRLDASLLTPERKLFLSYHRKTIFRR